MINFVLPFCSFILKLFIYFIFIGQFYALKHNDIIYKTSKKVITVIYIFIIISIICVLMIIILEPLIVYNEDSNLLSTMYQWTFVALNINEFILSISVIFIFIRKLVIAMKFEKISASSSDDAFMASDDNTKYVDETPQLGYTTFNTGLMSSNNMDNYLLNDDNFTNNHYEYKARDSKTKKLNIKETSTVHIMIRLCILSVFCIFWVELLFITLLNERFIDIDYLSEQYEIVRCIESFCCSMAILCIYLHFSINFKVYDLCCKCCHNCCLNTCAKCVAGKNKNNIIGNWNFDDDQDDHSIEMNNYRQMVM